MKKGIVTTCNGCKAFEESVRFGFGGGGIRSKAYCSIGFDIMEISEYKFKPSAGKCPKPKTYGQYIIEAKKHWENLKIN